MHLLAHIANNLKTAFRRIYNTNRIIYDYCSESRESSPTHGQIHEDGPAFLSLLQVKLSQNMPIRTFAVRLE